MKTLYQKIAVSLIDIFLAGLFVGYSLGASNVAEIHLGIPGLGFPIFLGEMVLMICGLLVLAAGPGYFFRMMSRPWRLIALIFGGWILVKAVTGYMVYGPLAFRHAAMFYYTGVALLTLGGLQVFGSGQTERSPDPTDMRGLRIAGFIVVMMSVILKFTAGYYHYFLFPYFVLGILCLFSVHSRTLRAVMLVVLMSWAFPCREFFDGGSSFILANGLAGTCALTLLLVAVRSFSRIWKILFALGGISLVIAGIAVYAPRSESRPFVTPREIWQRFQTVETVIQEARERYQPEIIPARLYKNNWATTVKNNRIMTVGENRLTTPYTLRRKQSVQNDTILGEISYNNVLFRMFIWRDMVSEMRRHRAVIGMPLGYSLRSPSIEILGQARGEWARDGWIEPHNSFLNFFYRGGLVGLALIAAMGFWQIRFLWVFTRQRSCPGILLASGLVYWNILACFLVIYELPYTAIPAWMWWGATIFCYQRINGRGPAER